MNGVRDTRKGGGGEKWSRIKKYTNSVTKPITLKSGLKGYIPPCKNIFTDHDQLTEASIKKIIPLDTGVFSWQESMLCS